MIIATGIDILKYWNSPIDATFLALTFKVVCSGRIAELPARVPVCTFGGSVRKGTNANKNPEFLVSPPGKLLVFARIYGRLGDFSLLYHHRNR